MALGGVGEIGMNLALYGYGHGRNRHGSPSISASPSAATSCPASMASFPDIRYLLERKAQLAGIVISHAHEDHYGALIDFWPQLEAPVFMTPFAAALLEAKRAGEPNAPKIPVTVVAPARARSRSARSRSNTSPSPTRSPSRTRSRSARRPARCSTPATGSSTRRRASARRPTSDRLAALGEEGVLALVSDSTNAIRDGVSPSEGEVAEVLERLIAEAPQRVAVTTFASNVARIRAVAAAAQRAGREVVVVGRAIRRAVDVARELGYLDGLPAFLDQETYGICRATRWWR